MSPRLALSHCRSALVALVALFVMHSTVSFLRERLTRAPSAVLVLGSGLGALADEIGDPLAIPYGAIPGFPKSTVKGHAGRLIAGILNGVEVVALQGRFHLYEGVDAGVCGLPIRALAALGAEIVVLTNAAGGLRPGLNPGDLMLIADHLNLMGRNPLIGPLSPGDERFPDMSDPYDRRLRKITAEVALEQKVLLQEGVYAGMLGPSYETPAEVRMLRMMGADAVGMSTVPEVIVARAIGLRVLAISLISNLASGISPVPLSHAEVLEAGSRVQDDFSRLIRSILPRISTSNLPTEAAG